MLDGFEVQHIVDKLEHKAELDCLIEKEVHISREISVLFCECYEKPQTVYVE